MTPLWFGLSGCGGPAAPPPPPALEVRVDGGAVWLGDRRLVASPFTDPETEILELSDALAEARTASGAERLRARVPTTERAASLSDLVYVGDRIGLPVTWVREDGAERPLSLVDFSRLAPTGWIVGRRSFLVTTVVMGSEGRREGNVALVSAPVTAGALDDPTSRPAGALDPREPVDCAAAFPDPAARAACERPPDVVPNAFAEGCFLPAPDPVTTDWNGRLAGLAPQVAGAVDERWLLVPGDLPLSEVAPLMDAFAPDRATPLGFMGGQVRQDCARSVPFTEAVPPSALGAVMVGKGLHHEMARKPPRPAPAWPPPRPKAP